MIRLHVDSVSLIGSLAHGSFCLIQILLQDWESLDFRF